MTRRHKIAAITLVSTGLLFVGMGARQDERMEPSPETCKSDLASVFDWCASTSNHFPCKYVEGELADACQAGCVMWLCPEEVPCTGMDPMFCAPCTDDHGARYWFNSTQALLTCEGIGPRDGFKAWNECTNAEMKAHCPALNVVKK